MFNTRSLALTAVSVGSVALQAAAQICYRYSFETNVDYVGQDITNVKSPNPYDCCGFCADQLACNAFSWTDFEGGTCWLKSTKGETKPSNGTTSAYDPKVDASSTCPNLHNDVYYTGEELVRLRSVKSAGDCCVECGKRPECLTFTWNPDSVYGGYCTLQKTAGELKPYAGYVSGGRQAADPTCPPIQSGVAYSTNYLTSVQGVQSSGDCCAKCKENSQCAVFTWYFNSPYLQCSLYTAGAKLVASDAAFSGVPAGSCGSIEENVDYGGADLTSIRASKAEDCCGLCNATKGCGAFSWNNYNGGMCWLKADKGTTTSRNGVRSAVITSA